MGNTQSSQVPLSPSRCTVKFDEQILFGIGPTRYLGLPVKDLQIPVLPDHDSLVTIIPISEDYSTNQSWLDTWANNYMEIDDVFRTEFMDRVIFLEKEGSSAKHRQPENQRSGDWPIVWSTSLFQDSSRLEGLSGPHIINHGKLFKAYRLFDDIYSTFMVTIRPDDVPGSFRNLRIAGDFYQSLSVAVPARKPPGVSRKGPFDGLRFAVKDLFDLEGLQSSMADRAYYDFSKPAAATAPLIQRLLDGGAHIVGKLKLGSLIAREEPTEAIDWHAPFNPRGDGYQSAWSSSSGTGAAIAAYEWLDFALATDTTGSSRRPALANGCFQIRLSYDALPTEGMIPSFAPFDAPALYGRNFDKFEDLIGNWIGAKPDQYSDISLVYLEDFLPLSNNVQNQLINSFIEDMESTHGVQTLKVSIAEAWKSSSPKGAKGMARDDFFQEVGVNSFCYGVYHTLANFQAEYHKKYGKEPYVNPVTRWRWDIAQTVSKSQHDDAMVRLKVYKEWFLKEILQVDSRNTLLILPITNQQPDYRDEPPAAPTAPDAFDSLWLAPILGAPEVTVPIGEMEYHSRVSRNKEHLPITVSVLGPPGTDMALIEAVTRCLKKSGRALSVKTGSRMF